ncbi:hypothetical protein [Lachnospira pectinoschiza]|uniref:hypothetical protein n=1 Tax=Lachnospira pectinoschiza TaxID=28052 RepID=UPI0015D66CD7|nr:hypothetical protein [Lachnospira pectinoschiza]
MRTHKWIDCSKITNDTKELAECIRNKTGLYLAEGSQYGSEGNKFLLLNVACLKAVLEDGLSRLEASIHRYINHN